eukprot:SAG22_NODE_1031_length_5932_cov_2.590948_4_plen_378_part_00
MPSKALWLNEGTDFWAANTTFLVTGWVMIIGNQQLGYYQANSPYSFLAGIAQYVGMSVGGLGWLAGRWLLFGGPRPFEAARRSGAVGGYLKQVLLVALPDIADTFFTIFGILNLGSGLFIIVFSFVTVLAALIRWAFLRKKLHSRQWVALGLITGVLIFTGGADQLGSAGGFDRQRLVGLVCTLVATLMDAIMYVCSERLLGITHRQQQLLRQQALQLAPTGGGGGQQGGDDRSDGGGGGGRGSLYVPAAEGGGVQADGGVVGPDAAELCALVGLINLPLASIYVVGFTLAGHWPDYVADPIRHNGCGGTAGLVAWLWLLQAGMYFLHYLSFYYTVSSASSVAAGVNKAVQGTTIFTLSHLFYCPAGPQFLMQGLVR